jgi:hypothetical protein
MREVRLRYTEPLVRQAVRSFVFRAVGRQLGARFLVVVVLLVGLVAWLMSRHDRGWTVGYVVATLVFACVFVAAIYVAHYRNTVGRFRAMRTPEATFGYDEQQFTLTSDLGSATMPWSTITEVWRYPRFWLLLFSRAQFVTLPLDDLDEPARAFITQRTGK